MSHAILSPSSASRWLSCTPSARLEQQFPDTSGAAAKEGTLAHSLGELLIRQKAKMITKPAFKKALAEIEDSEFYDEAMLDHMESYATFVMEQFAIARAVTKDALIFLEQRLDMTDYVPEGFGTGDVVIIADGTMQIIDLKYGKGVPVFAERNKQMMLYSLGALREFDFLYDIGMVNMTIYQPRLDSITTCDILVTELRQWAEEELKPLAALAFDGEGEFIVGSHCRFCKAKAVCKANADYNLEVAQYEFKVPVLLDDAAIADILSRADAFNQWIKAVEEHALNEAVNNGKKWPGYKLVEGRSNRKYSEETLVASKLLNAGFAEDLIYKKEILGITAMEKAIGKKDFGLLLNDLLIKPPGKPTLVPESDKRPEFSSAESAVTDFSNN